MIETIIFKFLLNFFTQDFIKLIILLRVFPLTMESSQITTDETSRNFLIRRENFRSILASLSSVSAPSAFLPDGAIKVLPTG